MSKQITKYINADAIVSWPVFGISLGWALFANFLDALNNPPGFVVERFLAITSLHLLLFGLLFVYLKLASSLSDTVRTWSVSILVLVFSALRGWLLALILTAIRGDDLSAIAFRSISSIAVIGFPILLAAVVLKQVRDYSRNRQLILNEYSRVARVSEETQLQIRELGDVRVNAIRDLVLGSLSTSKELSSEQAAQAVYDTVENVVRPLSHELEREAGIVVPEISPISNQRLDWIEAIKSAFSYQNISPALVAISFLLTASTRILFFQSPIESLYLLTLASLGPWILLTGLKKMLHRIGPLVPRSMSVVFFILGVVAVGFIIGLLTLPASANSPQPLSLVFQAPFFLVAITTLLALANSTRTEAAAVNRRLEETTAELAWEVTKVLDQYRQLKRQLAKSLHGPIQTQLMSSLIRLEKSGSNSQAALDEVKRWLLSEFRAIEAAIRSGQTKEAKSLQSIFFELGEIWESVAIIRLNGSVSDAQALESDPRLMVTLAELIPELAFNAVKHGQANVLEFAISLSDQRTLLLSCVDNGSRPAEQSRVGLGTKLLDECAIGWRRYSKDEHTHTEIELPFSKDDLATLSN